MLQSRRASHSAGRRRSGYTMRPAAAEMLRALLVVAAARLSLQESQSSVQAVTKLSNSLVPKLFQALSPGRDNLVLAPFGVASAAGILLEAASGDTARELHHALGIAQAERQALRDGFKAYFDTFEHSAESLTDEAAGAFSMATVHTPGLLSPQYKQLLTQFYRVNVTDAAAGDPPHGAQALEIRTDAGVLSHWRDLDRTGTLAFLSPQQTTLFQRSGRVGDTIVVPMVPHLGLFRSGRVAPLACTAIELPLKVGTFNLLILLPDAPDHIDELLVKLPGVSFQQLPHWLTYAETEVSLPQFTALSSGLDLTPFMKQLGVRSLFNASAAELGFASASGAPPLYVKSITQDAFFSASYVAVNSVGAVSSHMGTKRPKREVTRFFVDQPFLFFLLHRDTQLVLLAGKVQNPTQVP
ncbi:intracellular coagulation inhibitor 3-like [Schistocerca americana]|uniref:intracellular coagulation inhibitor 3-like n=1 Tax=Schistocerca americana TaxID=7009 RepID=UPI001F4F3FE0|nr:intracellular coagulation inhibitor 3-like [Schistocerca americana]